MNASQLRLWKKCLILSMRKVGIILLLSFSPLYAQQGLLDTVVEPKVLVGIHYATGWPGGDLVHRYGYVNLVGFSAGYKTKNNWFVQSDASFVFGSKVKVNGLLDNITDSYGNITDVNGDPAAVSILCRGVTAQCEVGKIIPLSRFQKNSGIMWHVGVGYLNHRIKIETQTQVVPMIELDYKKGYDRLTTGIGFSQFIGYAQLARSSFYNFYGGIYALQGITKERRTIYFDQPETQVSTKNRIDLLFGVKIGWFIPFYSTKKDYYIEY